MIFGLPISAPVVCYYALTVEDDARLKAVLLLVFARAQIQLSLAATVRLAHH